MPNHPLQRTRCEQRAAQRDRLSIKIIQSGPLTMTMTRPLRNLTLTAHVTASVGWLGALAVFLAHALASLISQD